VPSDILLVFVKDPRPGAAKTRLIPALGPDAAAELYRALAEEEVGRTAPRGREYDRLFCFAPAEARSSLEAWFPGETFVAQEGADLGARMARAFEEAFRRGAARVAIIGTDVPGVTRDTVLAAFRALEASDVVLGPTHDGGYYLLALKRPQPALFADIAWSTPAVLPATEERARGQGLVVRRLEALRDIDTREDVRAERPRLEPLLARRPALRAAVDRATSSPRDETG
jgi:rSAM/selenodomain-associated transferase 1